MCHGTKLWQWQPGVFRSFSISIMHGPLRNWKVSSVVLRNLKKITVMAFEVTNVIMHKVFKYQMPLIICIYSQLCDYTYTNLRQEKAYNNLYTFKIKYTSWISIFQAASVMDYWSNPTTNSTVSGTIICWLEEGVPCCT